MSNVSAVAVTEKQVLSIPNKTPFVFAAMLGAIILLAVGFAPLDVVHNAAHDTRHVHAFPCH